MYRRERKGRIRWARVVRRKEAGLGDRRGQGMREGKRKAKTREGDEGKEGNRKAKTRIGKRWWR